MDSRTDNVSQLIVYSSLFLDENIDAAKTNNSENINNCNININYLPTLDSISCIASNRESILLRTEFSRVHILLNIKGKRQIYQFCKLIITK